MAMRTLLPASALCALGLSAGLGRADVITVVATKDNTLYESQSTELSNGAGNSLFVGRTNLVPGEDIRRALVEFDLRTIVPAGSVVTSATLRLRMNKTQVGATTVSVHLMTRAWGEGTSNASGGEGMGEPATAGDATWNFALYPTTTWFTPGGDFVLSSASATTSVAGSASYDWTSARLAADVQAWVDNSALNFGWIVLGDETVAQSAKRFDSRESNDTNARPALIVEFTPPGSTGACCLPSGSCAQVTATECSTLGGNFHGAGTSCATNPCGGVTGACCLPSGGCVVDTAAGCLARGGAYQGDAVTCASSPCPVVLTPFVDELPRPAPAVPVSGTQGGAAEYHIAARQIHQRLHRDLPETTLWGYDGKYPGPTIEATTGLPVTVRWINDLRNDTGQLRTEHFLPVDLCLHGPHHAGPTARIVTHLHGGHVPPASDGYPEHTLLPGEEATYVYPNEQPAATLWYHDHALGITRLNVMMGLAGYYLVRDAFEQSLGLPSGAFEVPLVLQDRTFRADGSIDYPASWDEHYFGDKVLVNGKVWPYLRVKKGKYRFRILNGSNSRTYRLHLSNGRPFVQIGSDGGLLPAPVTSSELVLTPGERADVIVDFQGVNNNPPIQLVNSAPAPYPNGPASSVVAEVMQFEPEGGSAFTGPLPAALRPLTPLLETAAVTERELLLRKDQNDPCTGFRWLIDGLDWDTITERPVLGTSEVWSFVNPTSVVHPMHMHLIFFQVLDRQPFDLVGTEIVPTGPRVPPDPNEIGWKDTVRAMPHQITRVIARFEGWAGLYPYHCHILEHEDHEMMRQFETQASVGAPFCFGVACPCGNVNPEGGCMNSTGKASVLFGTGSASVATDDLVLTAVNLPPTTFGIPFMGGAEASPSALGNGQLCVAAPLYRFPVVQANAQGLSMIGPGLGAVAQVNPPGGWIVAGSTWRFQYWYRDVGGPCGAVYNATNGVAVQFTP
jgi:spore coat protein A